MTSVSITKKSGGFSLVEFLIGMTMTTLIFIVATNLVIGFLSVNSKSQRSQDIEQAKHDITSELTAALQWGSPISFANGVLTVGPDTYSVSNQKFLKNGVTYTSDKVLTTAFTVDRVSTADGLVSFDVHLDFVHKDSTSVHDTLALFISARLP